MIRLFKSIPGLIVVVFLFNISVLFPGFSSFTDINWELIRSLPSGARLEFSLGDVYVVFGLAILFLEIFKATDTSTTSIIEHVFSMLLFILCLVELLLIKPLGTVSFLLVTMMTLVDVLAGISVGIIAARRDIGFKV